MQDYIFGFNVFKYTPEELISYAADHSLSHIEINISNSHSNINSFTKERIDKLLQKTSENNISLSLHLPNQINIADNIYFYRKSNISFLSDAIELAASLKATYITCHVGFFFWFPVERWQRRKALKRFVTNLSSVLNRCENNNVILALENVTPLPHGSDYLFLGDNINDFEYIFSKLKSDYVKFCLDTGHANLAEGVDFYMDYFSHKLQAVHYHDNFGDDDAHLEINNGTINWSSFSNKLKQINYHGPFISECKNVKPHQAAQQLMKFLQAN